MDSKRTLEEELEFEDCCPWLEDELEDEQEDEEWEEVVEEEIIEWVVTDEIGVDDVGSEENDDTKEEDTRVVIVMEEGGKKKRKRRMMLCPVCGDRFSHLARHASEHLPWFWYPSTCCQDCSSQHLFLDFLDQHRREHHLSGRQEWNSTTLGTLVWKFILALGTQLQLNSKDEIITYLNNDDQLKKICKGKKLTDSDLDLCRALDTTLENSPETFTLLDSNGNFNIFSTTHWRLILQLLSKLTEDQRNSLEIGLAEHNDDNEENLAETDEWEVQDEIGMSEAEESEETMPDLESSDEEKPEITQSVVHVSKVDLHQEIEIADAHLHFDILLNRVGDPDLQDFDQFGGVEEFHSNLGTLVSNYCFPKFWPKRTEIPVLISKFPELRFTFGMHPKTIQSTKPYLLEEYLNILEEKLKLENTVAIGECGLDTSDTTRNLNFKQQIEYFEKQLELAVDRNLTVVVHCRGNYCVHLQLLDSLVKILPSTHHIHWHCFSGLPLIYKQATAKFNNIVFGVTPFIFTKPAVETFVQNHNITNLVLESDAPYILYRNQPSDPYVVNFIAKRISELLDIPLEEVCRITTENMKKIYKLD